YGAFQISGGTFHHQPVTITSADPANPAVLTGMYVRGAKGLTFSNLVFSTAGSADAFPFRVYNSHRITLTDLSVHGAIGNNNPNYDQSGLMLNGNTKITVSNSEFQWLRNGIGEMNNTGITISNNSIHDMLGDGIDNAGSTNVLISGNTLTDFHPIAGGQHPDGIQFWTNSDAPLGSNITVTGNVITRGAGGLVQGIFMRSTPGMPFNGVTISGNTAAGLEGRGISVQGGENLTINNNTVTSYTDMRSRLVVQASTNVSVTNNVAERFTLEQDVNLVQQGNQLNQPVNNPVTGGAGNQPVILSGASGQSGGQSSAGQTAAAGIPQIPSYVAHGFNLAAFLSSMAGFGGEAFGGYATGGRSSAPAATAPTSVFAAASTVRPPVVAAGSPVSTARFAAGSSVPTSTFAAGSMTQLPTAAAFAASHFSLGFRG
ncbi:MAG: right-handed parallel beta-helix repeat-containing protein, partial [Caulobacteraceae bacterium]